MNLIGCLAECKRLIIGVHRDKFHALQAGIHHAIHGVRTCAAYTDNLNCRKIGLFFFAYIHLFKFNHKASPSSVFLWFGFGLFVPVLFE